MSTRIWIILVEKKSSLQNLTIFDENAKTNEIKTSELEGEFLAVERLGGTHLEISF